MPRAGFKIQQQTDAAPSYGYASNVSMASAEGTSARIGDIMEKEV